MSKMKEMFYEYSIALEMKNLEYINHIFDKLGQNERRNKWEDTKEQTTTQEIE